MNYDGKKAVGLRSRLET